MPNAANQQIDTAMREAYTLFRGAQDSQSAPWLAAQREDSARHFFATGLPSNANEAWKYTDLGSFRERAIDLWHENAAADADGGDVDRLLAPLRLGTDANRLVIANGRFNREQSAWDNHAGVTINSFSALNDDETDHLFSRLGAAADSRRYPMAALNAAGVTDGLHIRIDAGVTVDAPLHIIHANTDNKTFAQPRVVIDCAKNSRLRVVQHHLGVSGLTNATNELFCADSSTLKLIQINGSSTDSFTVVAQHAHLERDSRLEIVTLDLGRSLSRFDLVAELCGSGAHAEVSGLFMAGPKEHVDLRSCIEHTQPNTTSNQTIRGLMGAGGHGVFNGRIVVHEGADGTDAQLNNRNLLLGERAEIDTKPELEIYADDVKCSHGATTGRLDENALHYLRTRGVPHADARRLLVHAFVEDVIVELSGIDIETTIRQTIQERTGCLL